MFSSQVEYDARPPGLISRRLTFMAGSGGFRRKHSVIGQDE
jgi:hypothetical protein